MSIEASGPGLPPDVVDRLFPPFLGTKADGMGVGLPICQTIVAGHGGRIWTERSTLGGTGFHFTRMDASGDADG